MRFLKGLFQFIFSLAILCAFMYPRMWPLIRRSMHASRAAKAGPTARPGARGSAQPAQREAVVSFAGDVSLRKDATLEVREEFTVHSEGDYFRYGMVRDLPIDSEARWDRRYAGEYQKDTGIRVKILEVTEDGAPVSYEQGSDRATRS